MAVIDRLESTSVTSNPAWAQVMTHPHFAHAREELGRTVLVDPLSTPSIPVSTP